MKQTIEIFARVKPAKGKTGVYEIESIDDGGLLSFFIPKDLSSGLVNNKKENYKFKFSKIFDQKAQQEEIFDNVAKPVIDNVISGYNGTIFAYGQTGSGKTFTITGGAEKYSQRGIIPRSLSYIYEVYEKMPGREFSTSISYLEIYNESGYDLLDPKHDAAKLEDLPKVTLMEDEGQNIHLKNLSIHPAGSEEDALNLLFLGDTNRMIAETPMNQASTRSHCIFTIYLMSKDVGSATVRRSKLHLVDLAGSERVSKTGINGVLLSEAKYINLSLHYLEQVIIALSEKSRSHIPYRNSMMTSVLRDSLGGNCMTTMIATCSVEKQNVDESISTCRFAQRVAMIKNEALINEELDPRLMVERLKQEIALLKEELAMATGHQRTDALNDEEVQKCTDAVLAFLDDKDPEAVLAVGADMRKIQLCYQILKKQLQSQPKVSLSETDQELGHYDKMEQKKLQDLLLQRDNEINILVNMLKKEKKKVANGRPPTADRVSFQSGGDSMKVRRNEVHVSAIPSASADAVPHGHSFKDDRKREDLEMERSSSEHSSPHKSRQHSDFSKQILGSMSLGRQQAFEIFKRDYHENENIENNKRHLKRKYSEAKSLGESINNMRNYINKTKSQIEQLRVKRAIEEKPSGVEDEAEMEMKAALENAKSSYKTMFSQLRDLKSEIEHLQHFLERSKVQLMKDFELWWAEQMTAANSNSKQDVKSAWKTPPPSSASSTDSQAYSKHNDARNLPDDKSFTRTPRGPALRLGETNPRKIPPLRDIESASSKHSSGSSQINSSLDTLNQSLTTQSDQADIPLTGDAETDADILAFLKARQNAIKLAQSRSGR